MIRWKLPLHSMIRSPYLSNPARHVFGNMTACLLFGPFTSSRARFTNITMPRLQDI
ncbi:hypothetical protein BGZ60DRAFT_394512 [Tricladium varicosporioides]|nr:hypothetical protein BGZ60DRAFT_394512 [Hymenoscyphus varicosporioides]